MNHLRKRWLALFAVILAGVAGLALTACGSDDSDGGDESSSSSAGDVQTSIKVGMNSPTYSTQMTTYVAIDQGYFKDVGIDDVEVIQTDDYIPGLVGGSLQFTQGDTDALLLAAHEGADVKLIGNYRAKEFQMLAVGPGIESAEDLKGKKVTGGDRGSRNEAVVKQLLTGLGVSPDEVDFVPFGGGSDDRLQALLAGQISGTNLFPRHTVPLEDGGGKFLTDEVVNVPQESVATTGDYLDENYDTVVAYWTAILKAREFIADKANKDAVIQIAKDSKLEVLPEYLPVYDKEIIQISPDGGFDPADMDKLITDEQDLELVPADLEWRDYFDFKPLNEAQAALGLPENPSPDAL